jgi:hypothetical protein
VAGLPQEPVCFRFPGDDLFTPHERRGGLPIGNQTSQLFANVMLDPLDHFSKETLRIEGYLRYCDDMLLFGHDAGVLRADRERLREFLAGLRLRLHPDKSVIFPVRVGIPFLGYRIFPTYVWLGKSNVHRMRRRMRSMQRGFAAGRLSSADVHRRIVSWIGHASHARSPLYVHRLLKKYPFRRGRQDPKK